MRKDLKMPRGKIAAQAAHASMAAVFSLFDKDVNASKYGIPAHHWQIHFEPDGELGQWLNGSFTKVCLAANSEQELADLYDQAKAADLLTSKIVDNGLTVFDGVPTWTCIAIGPAMSDRIDPITSHLKLYN